MIHFWYRLVLGLVGMGLLVMACGPRTAKEEAEYMLSKYKDKMDRPSPPAMVESTIGNAHVSLDYSQPSVRERTIWGKLVKYDEIWRTGANEANVFETSADVRVGNDTIPAGKYSLFTIPTQGDWTVILNKIHNQWGVYDYNKRMDQARIQVTPYKDDKLVEKMTFNISDQGKVKFSWEYLRFDFSITSLP